QGDGYRIEVTADSFDAVRFEGLFSRGNTALQDDPATASRILKEALDLWYGTPYGDLDTNPTLATEIARLQELRLVAVESRIEADLATGNHAAVVGELETLVRQYPLRERFRAQQMVALYRCGR